MKFRKWLSALLTLCLLSTLSPVALMEEFDVQYEEPISDNLEDAVEEITFDLGNDAEEIIEEPMTIESDPFDSLLGSSDNQPVGPYDETIKENYKKCLTKLKNNDGGRSSFSGWCGQYTRYQLEVSGINYVSSTNVFNGNKIYYGMVDNAVTNTGYIQKKYEGENCINDIIRDYGNKVENIVVSWYKQNGHSINDPGFGHTHFINGIIDGMVYLSESYSASGLNVQEGYPIKLSIDEYMARYNHNHDHAIGAILFLPEVLITSLTLSSNNEELNVSIPSSVATLKPTIIPDNATTKGLIWESDNPSVATVSENGIVTPVSVGEANIQCKTTDRSGITATCHVKVISFTLNKHKVPEAYIGYTDKLVGKIGDKEVKCTFSSDNSNVVKVDKNGKITAKKDGIATITATASSGETDTCKVTVHPKPKSVALNMSNGFCLNAGQTFQMKLEYTPSDALPAGPVTWSSSKQSVARIDEKTGFITALAEGTTNIKCKIKGTSGKTVKLEVVDPNKPAALKLTYDKSFDGKTLDINQDLHLSCAFTPEKATSDIEWKTSSSKIATVTNGVVKPLKEGTVTITATATKNKKATASIKITIQDKHKPTGMAVSINGKECKKGGTVGVERGDPVKVDVKLSPATATTRYTTTSSKPKVAEAKVTDSGEIYLHCYTEGTTKITISTSVKKVSINFNVKVTDPNKPSEVIIMEKILEGKKEKPREMTIGETLQLNAVVLPLTALSAVTWSAKNPSVVSVTADGFITAKKNGTAKITATSVANEKISETISIKVSKAPAPTSIFFYQDTVPLTKGQTYQLTPDFTPAKASSTITWTAKGCVSVDKNGMVTAKSTGNGSVTAKTENKKYATVQFIVYDKNVPSEIKVTNISVEPSSATLKVGETLSLSYTITPDIATEQTVKLATSDASVAKIKNGDVLAVGVGTAIITITAKDGSGVSGQCEVTVKPEAANITLDQTGTISMKTGESFKLNASVEKGSAGQNLRWYASDFKDGGYAAVDKHGTVYAYKAGKVTINVVDDNGGKASVNVDITTDRKYSDDRVTLISMINNHRRKNLVYEVPLNDQKSDMAQQGARDVMDGKEVTNSGFWLYMGGGIFAGNWSYENTLAMRLEDSESTVGNDLLRECDDGIGLGGIKTWTQCCVFIQF